MIRGILLTKSQPSRAGSHALEHQTLAYVPATAAWRNGVSIMAPRDGSQASMVGAAMACVRYLLHPSTRTSTIREEIAMQAIAVRDRDAGLAGLSLTDLPYPHAAEERRHRARACRRLHPWGAGLAGDVD